jgi:hypothetical protein
MARPKLCLALLAFTTMAVSTPARAFTIPPDSTSEPLSAIGCFFASGSLDNISDLTCPPANCLQECDAANNRAKNELHIATVDVGRRYTESTVYTDFTVLAASDGSATALDGTISYDVSWSGAWTLAGILPGFNDVKSTMTLILWDQTASGKLVAQAQVHSLDASSAGGLPELPVDVGVGWDHGSVTNSLAAKVIRGHTYRIGLKVRIEGKGALNADINVDYLTASGWGLEWDELRVTVGPDLAEELAKLEKRVDQLEEDLHHHTHTYLTGKGEGHNNTVLPPDKDKKPLPAPSVLVTTAPNPFNPVATITYALPGDMAVTLRVYDAQGRLVTTLVDSDLAAGEHKTIFNASGLASGVYYYRIDAGPYSETRKITLLK